MIEKGTHLRVKLIGTRSDVGSMFAIGSIKEDFLGFGRCDSLACDIADLLVGRCEGAFDLIEFVDYAMRSENHTILTQIAKLTIGHISRVVD